MRWSHLIATDKSIVNLHELKYFKSSILLLCALLFLCAFTAVQYGLILCLSTWLFDKRFCTQFGTATYYDFYALCLRISASKSSRYFYHLVKCALWTHSWPFVFTIVLLIIASFDDAVVLVSICWLSLKILTAFIVCINCTLNSCYAARWI